MRGGLSKVAQLNDTVEELPAGAELHHEVDFDLVLRELSESGNPRAQSQGLQYPLIKEYS